MIYHEDFEQPLYAKFCFDLLNNCWGFSIAVHEIGLGISRKAKWKNSWSNPAYSVQWDNHQAHVPCLELHANWHLFLFKQYFSIEKQHWWHDASFTSFHFTLDSFTHISNNWFSLWRSLVISVSGDLAKRFCICFWADFKLFSHLKCQSWTGIAGTMSVWRAHLVATAYSIRNAKPLITIPITIIKNVLASMEKASGFGNWPDSTFEPVALEWKYFEYILLIRPFSLASRIARDRCTVSGLSFWVGKHHLSGWPPSSM